MAGWVVMVQSLGLGERAPKGSKVILQVLRVKTSIDVGSKDEKVFPLRGRQGIQAVFCCTRIQVVLSLLGAFPQPSWVEAIPVRGAMTDGYLVRNLMNPKEASIGDSFPPSLYTFL